jgi:hypothetical protein
LGIHVHRRSTGPGTGENGKTYTVIGKIKQLYDYTRLSDFALNATCPG